MSDSHPLDVKPSKWRVNIKIQFLREHSRTLNMSILPHITFLNISERLSFFVPEGKNLEHTQKYLNVSFHSLFDWKINFLLPLWLGIKSRLKQKQGHMRLPPRITQFVKTNLTDSIASVNISGRERCLLPKAWSTNICRRKWRRQYNLQPVSSTINLTPANETPFEKSTAHSSAYKYIKEMSKVETYGSLNPWLSHNDFRSA